MTDIIPKYEVLYSDLKNHYIGGFLASREFKLFMSETESFEKWKEMYERIKANRGYFSFGTDPEPSDATETFAIYLNAIPQNPRVEHLVTNILSKFILHTNEETDFSDLLQSLKISQFKEENIEIIRKAIEEFSKKSFMKKEVKPVDSKKSTKKEIDNKTDIFIVHGHNEEVKHNVARLLEKIKLRPIILNEQSNEGLTIIEKFEKYSNVSFAIILLTFDDYGKAKSSENNKKRARQNVILELGYFIAKLGRNNVLPLYENDVELPSDISGVLYTKIDESENWKIRLIKELKTAGFKVDANDIL
jgi:predicted nucleotide-binding protein